MRALRSGLLEVYIGRSACRMLIGRVVQLLLLLLLPLRLLRLLLL